MKTLVDTQCFYWSLCEGNKLSRQAREAMQDEVRVKVLSVAVFWEMTIKHGIGKLRLPQPVEVLWEEAEAGGIAVVGIRPAHLRGLAALDHHHNDPFDRVMIAQALVEDWEVVSSDEHWDAYGVRRIW